jgi:tetratricopeptide (TPR) repeat protein
MGVASAELWSNLGLCCWAACQYDMALGCFLRALDAADDAALPDVWYNIGQVRGRGLLTAGPGRCRCRHPARCVVQHRPGARHGRPRRRPDRVQAACGPMNAQVATRTPTAHPQPRVPQVALGVGDLALAYQCWRLAHALNPEHVEALTNLAALEARQGRKEQVGLARRSGWRRQPPAWGGGGVRREGVPRREKVEPAATGLGCGGEPRRTCPAPPLRAAACPCPRRPARSSSRTALACRHAPCTAQPSACRPVHTSPGSAGRCWHTSRGIWRWVLQEPW